MSSLNIETVTLYLLFIVPGFISMKVYDLMVPSERRDFSKSLLDAFGFGCINLALFWWLFISVNKNNFSSEHYYLYYLAIIGMLFVAPVTLPIVFLWAIKIPFLKRRVVHPLPKPWDFVFSTGKNFWVILHLKDGRRIGGRYSMKSFASSYPNDEQIYLEEVWKLDENGIFKEKVDRTNGIIITLNDCNAIELYQ